MNYNFYGQYSEKEQDLFKYAQGDDLKKICRYLKTEISLLENIKFEIFDSREGKQNADPNHSISRASARFNEMTVYRFWLPTEDPHFPHETTHLVAHKWSRPYIFKTELDTWDSKKISRKLKMVSTSFMQEGLAIAVDDIVFKRKLLEERESKFIDKWCREQIDKMPKSLEKIINLDGFGSVENKVVVPFAASLSKYLLQEFGVDRYKSMYIQLKETISPEENVKVIEGVYGLTEKEILDKWRMFL